MIYNDGVNIDENKRIIICPNCENESNNLNAVYCKICGTVLYNYCEGEPQYNYNDNSEETIYHKNDGDARFCEVCGKPTALFKNGFLKPWDEVINDIKAIVDDTFSDVASTNQNDEIPF